jgi:hypothetical protein
MTDLFDPLALAATAATIGALVWVAHLADKARRARPLPPAEAPCPTAPQQGGGHTQRPAAMLTATHRPWVVVPEGIGSGAVLAQAEAGTHPTHPTFSELVLPLDGCGADAQVTSTEPPPCP